MARLWVAGLLAVVGAAGMSVPLGAQLPWKELRDARFVLRGAIATESLTTVACDVDRAARVVRMAQRGAEPPVVVAVDGARAIREWLPQFQEGKKANPLGAYWSGLFGHHIVVRVDTRPAERFRRILHEYAHYTTHLVHRDPPRWLDEGLSELWEHAAITPRAVEVGRPVADHVKRLRAGKGWIPLPELVAANAVPGSPAAATAMFYAQSWALVHYLMGDGASGQIGPDPIPALGDLPTDDELRRYVAGPMAKRVTMAAAGDAAADCRRPRPVRTMSQAESELRRAQAIADGDRSEAALPVLQGILQGDPENVDALEVLGFVHFTGNRPAASAAIFDRVIAGGKASYISFYYRAVLAGPVPDLAGGAGPVPQVEYLQKAVGLNPAFAPAAERLKQLSGKGLALALLPGLVRE